MQLKSEKYRLKKIQKFYRNLGIESEEDRKYFVALANLPSQQQFDRPIIFIEAGITSNSRGELKSAGLEPASE